MADSFAVRVDASSVRVADDPRTAAAAPAATPWTAFRAHARSVGMAVATCAVVLLVVELAVFRSGFFVSHVTFSSAAPAAKLALATHYQDVRVLYVGDSTVLTGVMPTVVSDRCRCGGGFNAAFASADPWLTAAMTDHVIALEHPGLVAIGVPPWYLGSELRFAAGPYSLELLTPEQSAALGVSPDPAAVVDAKLGAIWSAYGQRALIQEWMVSLVPGQRYDESERGYEFVPGSLLSRPHLEAEAVGLENDPSGAPSARGPGASVIGSLVSDLRGRGIAAAILLPPLHPIATEIAGAYLAQADAAVRALAASQGAAVIDCRGSVSADDFRDLRHLNRDGATKYSTCVAAAIAALVGR
jgi:hypothetical protein